MDDANNPWQDDIIPSNTEGIDLSGTDEIDISDVYVIGCPEAESSSGLEGSCDKTTSVKLKFIMTTSDTSVTPSVDNLEIDWTIRQGDNSATAISPDGPWPTDYGDQQHTSSAPYYNSATYPAFKWISERHSGDCFYQNIYVLKDKIIGYALNSEHRLFSLDRDTGEE